MPSSPYGGGPPLCLLSSLPSPVGTASAAGVGCPEVRVTLIDPDAVVLVVNAAALLAVLDRARGGAGSGAPRTEAEVLAGLLGHESRYWHKSAVARGAVAVGCLIGSRSSWLPRNCPRGPTCCRVCWPI